MLAFVFLACVVGTLAAPAPQEPRAANNEVEPMFRIISREDVVNADGSFNYNFETSNGIKVDSTGSIKKNPGAQIDARSSVNEGEDDGDILSVVGSYSYPAPDGTIITVRYIADENGFQPMGDHLPAPHSNFVRAQEAQGLGSDAGFSSRVGKAVDPVPPKQAEPVPSQPEQAPTDLPGAPLGEQASLVETEESGLQKELEQ